MTWARGRETVTRLLVQGQIETITGSAANGSQLLASAHMLLESAAREVVHNSEAAYLLAFDAGRKAGAALVTQQGLRIRSGGHHRVLEDVIRAQFDGPFTSFGVLRVRRNEIEYPRFPGDVISDDEAREAIEIARQIFQGADALIDSMTLFRP